MVEIIKQSDKFIFEVKGFHKLWALKSRIIILSDHIVNVRKSDESLTGWKGWRVPGTYLPGVIIAGSYYGKGEKIFWDVMNVEKSIVVDLKDERYTKLIIEVENVEEAIKQLVQ
jgi:hypothetical protein